MNRRPLAIAVGSALGEIIAGADANGRMILAYADRGGHVYTYNPDQPRRPKGDQHGGEWVHDVTLGIERFEPLDESRSEDIKENSAQTREIDYVQIGTTLDSLEARSLKELSSVLEEIRDSLAAKVRFSSDLHKLVRDLAIPYQSDLRFAMRTMLQRGWDAGSRDARREVREQRRQYTDSSFTPRAALRWLKSQALSISGILSDRLLADVKNEILSGIRTGRATELIASGILALFLPYLGDPDVIRDGEQLAPYRLETIVRTNLTTSYNHGRLTEFVSKDLQPFLLGVRYSAILDTRTTEVCRFLDGKVFKPSSPDLESLLPPNHFNCRSIVVPIVVGSKINEKDFITLAEIGKAKGLADTKFLETRDAWKAYREAA